MPTRRGLDSDVLEVLAKLQVEAFLEGLPAFRVTSKRRSAKEQAKLYAQGRTSPGRIVTRRSGRPGSESTHQLGRAFDVAFEDPETGRGTYEGPWDRLGSVGERMGWRVLQLLNEPLNSRESDWADDPREAATWVARVILSHSSRAGTVL